MGQVNNFCKVTYEDKSGKMYLFDGFKYEGINTATLEWFDGTIHSSVKKYIDLEKDDNPYKIIIKKNLGDGTVDYQNAQMLSPQLKQDPNVEIFLYSMFQLIMGTSDINSQLVKFDKNANIMSLKKRCEYMQKLTDIFGDLEGTFDNEDTRKYDNSVFFSLSIKSPIATEISSSLRMFLELDVKIFLISILMLC